MRNVMICVSVMMALFLGWPLAFGGGNSGGIQPGSRAEARIVEAVVPKVTPAAATVDSSRPESCYKRFQRENRQCDGRNSQACKLKAADQWDMCEATGFWPEE